MTPLKELKEFQYYDATLKDREESNILWWIFFVIACILLFVYMIVVYLEYIDNPKTFAAKFNNEERLKYHGLSGRDMFRSEMLASSIKT